MKMAGRCKISLRLVPIKAHFFLYFGGVAAVWPFINVFAKQLGISSAGVALIFSAAPICGLIAKPLFGAFADRFKKKKTFFLFFILLNLVSLLCIGFLPQAKPERPVNFVCSFVSYIEQCGALTAGCNETVLDRLRNPIINGTTHPDRLEECEVQCEIFSFREGNKFCRSIAQPNNAPSICQRRPYYEDNGTFPDENDATPYELDEMDVADEESLSFVAKLKLWELEAIHNEDDPQQSCLRIVVDSIRYPSGDTVNLGCQQKARLSNCFINCPENEHLNLKLERILERDVFESYNFYLYGTLVIIAFVAMSVVCSVGDAICFQLLEDKPHHYGVQRQFGAMSWGLMALVAGYLIDNSSEGKLLKDYTPAFYLMGVMLALDLAISYKLDIKEVEKPKAWRKDMSSLLSDLRVIIFISACIIIGMCTGLQWYFLLWHVEDLALSQESCGSPNIKTLLGLISAVQSFLGEVPFFHFSGWFIRKLGHSNCITIVLGVFGVRFWLYSVLDNPWTILPVELLQGFTFGIFYATMTSYADSISPPGMSATVQGIFGGAFEGLGVAAGSLIGGLMFYRYGGSIVFRIFGCGAFVFCFMFFIATCVLGREKVYHGVSLAIREPEGQEMHQITASNPEVDSE